jgi:hypothetical protein
MPGHSRSKNGVASHACVPGIHVLKSARPQDVDGRDKPGHDAELAMEARKFYSAGVFGLGFTNVPLRLSQS